MKMTDPALPLPEPGPDESAQSADTPAGRPVRQLGVWLDLLDRLAERKEKHESGQAAQPPTKAQVLLDRSVWKIIIFARWLRPHLSRSLIDQTSQTLRQLTESCKRYFQYVYGRLLWQRRVSRTRSEETAKHRALILGWLRRQWLLLRTDPDRRLAAYGLAGGFAIPMTLIVILGHFTPQPIEPLLQPYIDPSIPAPSTEMIAEEEQDTGVPVEVPAETAAIATPVPSGTTPQPEPLSERNFRFEYFAQRDQQGLLHLMSHTAENTILGMFPLGTPAVNVMRFFGEVMLRSGVDAEEATKAAQSRCMAMPINKLFTVRTVTCTYGHTPPQPRLARESARSRVFWIMALSYDNGGRLIDLRVHARTTMAMP